MEHALDLFMRAALVVREGAHVHGDLVAANALLLADPELPALSIHAAAVTGDHLLVARFLAADPASVTAPGGPYGWDPLTHLCFSRYLRLDPTRSADFVKAATLLLDAGADPNGGWWEEEHDPKPSWESVLYGAAGLAHHPEMTRLLLERGADPNDGETPYHAPESYDNRALEILLQSGRLSPEGLALVLVRKADWHDTEGMAMALRYGAGPDPAGGRCPLHHALRRDNRLEMIEMLVAHGADPLLPALEPPVSAMTLAARRGRGDVLELLARRGVTDGLTGADLLLGACARADRAAMAAHGQHAATLKAQGGAALAEFAGNGNTDGVMALLDLGVPLEARYAGDGYFGLAPEGTALHSAAWRARHDTVAALLRRGADVRARNAMGQTPLMLAVAAATHSYWMANRRPDSVAALLDAGAPVEGIPLPTGYEAIDVLLQG